jgi:hypothetical protein
MRASRPSRSERKRSERGHSYHPAMPTKSPKTKSSTIRSPKAKSTTTRSTTTKSPKVDAYIEDAPEHAKPILKKLRRLIHKASPKIEETIKWGVPHFECNGIVCGMAAFKNHVGFGYKKSSLLSDPHGLFKDKPQSMCSLKITRPADLPADEVIIAYTKEAVRLNEEGVKSPQPKAQRRSADELEVPAYITTALKKNKNAWETWKGFAYSHRKEYVEWITEAKTDATRQRRIATMLEWVGEGKQRNWKYMKT